MAIPETGAVRAAGRALAGFLAALALVAAAPAAAQRTSNIVTTRHNLSASGTGEIRALSETRICVFCHTPHNAAPQSPLWNREIEGQTYQVYTSPTMQAGPLPQPTGPTKLCLSCHDGMIAMGAVLNPGGGIGMAGAGSLAPGSLTNFGLDLSTHHPVSFPYHEALPNPELAAAPPADLVFGSGDEIHCITCHDPHDDTNGKFLLKDNRYSALCTSCHQIPGWSTSKHATSDASVAGVLPRPPKTWPTYLQLGEWGCEACHTAHFAPTAAQLLNFTDLPPEPFSCTSSGACHGSGPGSVHGAAAAGGVPLGATVIRPTGGRADIGAQTRKVSAHHERPPASEVRGDRRTGMFQEGALSVGCTDCHNPHAAAESPAEAPYASGMLRHVGGVDRNGAHLTTATYEYEVCFKCHADNTPLMKYIPRVVNVSNLRLAFDPSNPSYHPVLAMGRSLNVPSIPSSLEPMMNPSVMIYCTTCHADDEGGSRGPHGSSFAPILRERYETTDYTPESYDNYALCYRCHDQKSILGNESFGQKVGGKTLSKGGHKGHLVNGAPCSACHDPHGVPDPGGAPTAEESYTHLINFDTRIVGYAAAPGATAPATPVFQDRGTFRGSCTLVCHGVDHRDGCPPADPTCVDGSYP